MLRLKVLTFNLQSGQVWDPRDPDGAPFDLDRGIDFLKGQGCDLALLQEVEFPDRPLPDTRRSPNYDRLRAALAGYHSMFAYPAATRPQLPFGIGLAIFSRWPLERRFHMVLPPADLPFDFRGERWLPAERSLIGASVYPDGREIQVLNTHLQAYFMIDSSADEHPEQRRLVEILLRGRKCPLILGGDLNSAPGEGTVAALAACGVNHVDNRQPTWRRLPYALDHLFHSPEFRLESFGLAETDSSDHHALRAELSLD